MCKILCITNSQICDFNFLKHIEVLAQSNLIGIVLREKHLSQSKYYELAKLVLDICNYYNMDCILHNYVDVAIELKHYAIHLPLPVLEREFSKLSSFSVIGASTHSLQQAKAAERLGASYITYGHIFKTDCKMGLSPKGVNSIVDIINNTTVSVYPLGGIGRKNYKQVLQQGAEGFAVMSELMHSDYNEVLNLAKK